MHWPDRPAALIPSHGAAWVLRHDQHQKQRALLRRAIIFPRGAYRRSGESIGKCLTHPNDVDGQHALQAEESRPNVVHDLHKGFSKPAPQVSTQTPSPGECLS